MKPIEIVIDERFDFSTHMVNEWIDEFGFVLMVEKAKWSIEFTNDYELISTDLFFGRSLRDTLNISRTILVKTEKNSSFIVCYGRDEFMRAFRVDDAGVSRIAPLSIGVGVLSILSDNANTGGLKSFEDGIVVFPYPMKQNISCYIASRVLKDIVW
jgi:hypothetical protein